MKTNSNDENQMKVQLRSISPFISVFQIFRHYNKLCILSVYVTTIKHMA